MSGGLFDGAPVIHSYTRAQALEDGELVDVTEWASAEKGIIGGFKIPVAMTRALWAAVEDIPERLEGVADVRGRAHDVLWMALCAIRRQGPGDRIDFKVILPRTPTDGGEDATTDRQVETLHGQCHGGDEGEPVVTLGYREDF